MNRVSLSPYFFWDTTINLSEILSCPVSTEYGSSSNKKNYSVVRVESSDAMKRDQLSQESAESSQGAETEMVDAKKGLVISHADPVEGEEDVGRGIARRMEKVRQPIWFCYDPQSLIDEIV